MKKNTKSQKNLQIVTLAILVLALLGLVIYIAVKGGTSTPQENTSQQQQPTLSEDDAKREAGAILSKIKMGMTKDEVIAAVGKPHSCSQSRKDDGTPDRMEQCSYGKKDAPGHALITFLDGKVWGTTYESGSIYTDSN